MGSGDWGVGIGVWGLGCGDWGVGIGVWGLGCGVWGVGYRRASRGALSTSPSPAPPKREFFIDNLLVRIHFIIVMIKFIIVIIMKKTKMMKKKVRSSKSISKRAVDVAVTCITTSSDAVQSCRPVDFTRCYNSLTHVLFRDDVAVTCITTSAQRGVHMCSGSEAGSYLRLIDFSCHSTLGVRVMMKKKKKKKAPGWRKRWGRWQPRLPPPVSFRV